MFKSIALKKGKDAALQRKHPWIFSGAINEKSLNDIENGEKVHIINSSGEFLAFGHYEKGTSIAVRILSFSDVTDFNELLHDKIVNALNLRKTLIEKDTNTYRLIHGEGDALPGLIIDIYYDSAVIQCHSTGMFCDIQSIASVLDEVYNNQLTNIYCKSSDTLNSSTGSNFFLKGSDESVEVLENGIKYDVNWITGQKTGLFLDQRENRKLIGRYAHNKDVLDLFSNTGGFSMNAMKAGAKSVISVDVSTKAIQLVLTNAKINEFNNASNHEVRTEDCLKFLQNSEGFYDIIVVDPPAFAKSLSKKHNAVQGYKRLNILALNRVKPGGLVFTFSCSQVIDEALFYNTIVAACIEAGRNVRVLHKLSQGPDHPVNIYHKEGSYLKGLVLEVN
jgi:23S rRNA (cytosine1962-C5)-methyltransferase